MDENDILFCENGQCRVIDFKPVRGLRAEFETPEDKRSNCPGCGQFGRTKGK